MSILIRDGRIAAVTSDRDAELLEGATVIDAAGKYVIPGLADLHVHLGLGTPLPRPEGETEEVLARELYYGVTGKEPTMKVRIPSVAHGGVHR